MARPRRSPTSPACRRLKTSDETFPEAEIRDAGYGAIWHGQKGFNGVAMLAKGADPVERQRRLPGDDEDVLSRYLEAEVDGLIVASIYLPNGNPVPGPKFDYKLGWMERLIAHAAGLLADRARRSCLPATIMSSRPMPTCGSPRRWPAMR